jgi:glyoxalase family protein
VVDASGDEPLIADHPEIPAELALHGFEGVRAYSAAPPRSASLLERVMNAEPRDDGVFELRGDTRGGWIALDEPPAERGRQSAGTVHHIAWGTTDAEQGAWLDRLNEARVPNSGLIDRHYFHSLYFREPGGVLFELATEEPGFTVDGPVEELGRRIILPPWLESQREQVEARLTPLPDPRAGWAPTG